MSKFFKVTLDTDIALNDNVTNDYNGWTSEKILREILAHRITKFESLEDVDVTNKQDKQIMIYSGATKKFTTIDINSISESAGIGLKQISKMGMVGSASTPAVIELQINTVDFKVPKVNVLKFQQGTQNIVVTKNTFDISENSLFMPDDMVVFDGTAHLQTSFDYKFNYDGVIGDESCKSYGAMIDKSKFKTTSSISLVESGVDAICNIKATPLDRLLLSKDDINLSNASNIDYFNLIATGTNIRVICSIDSGKTWKTFNTDHWEGIDLNVNDIASKGISFTAFNQINSTYWNLLITIQKIRFAYLMQNDNSVNELKVQYDGKGTWVEAKPTEYDVIYASNTLLQLKLYFSGDIKINY